MSEVIIKYGQFDPTAKPDSTLTVSEKKSWSNIADLKRDSIEVGNFMTCEKNLVVLDDSMVEFPASTSDQSWGWWSESMSGIDGRFAVPPTLDVRFNSNHKSSGITLYFYPSIDSYAKEVRVTWYNSANQEIKSRTYTLEGATGEVFENVANYRRIKIEMLSTNVPYRYIKLLAIDYGITRTFEDSEINTANVLEEIDPIGDILSVNTLNFQVKTHYPEFSLVTGSVANNPLMKAQKMSVSADGKPFGTFFLDDWKDVNNNGLTFDFSAIDATGLMDKFEFMGGIYKDKLANNLLSEIFDKAFPNEEIEFKVDPNFLNSKVSGWLPICSCREALQQVCFAIGAIVECTREGYVWIYPREEKVKEDSTPTANDRQIWSNVEDLKLEGLIVGNFMTCERNYSILNGEMSEFPNVPQNHSWGWFSNNMSDENGLFANPPTLDIAFTTDHNSRGLTINFYPHTDDYANRVRVTWFNRNGEQILSGEYDLASSTAQIRQAVYGYRRIEIEILSTNNPNRYVKLRGLDYGISNDITLDQLYIGGTIEPTEYYNGLNLTAHTFFVDTTKIEQVELLKEELPAGEHKIVFKDPVHSGSLKVTGGTIKESGANYAIINVKHAGEVVISGNVYSHSKNVFSIRKELSAGEIENIVEFDNCTLVSADKAHALAQKLFDYLAFPARIESDVILNDLGCGNRTRIETYGLPIVGYTEKLDINLRSCKAKIKVVGDVMST